LPVSCDELMPRSALPRTPSKLSESVRRQLNSYAFAASAAGVGLLALAQPAEAKIVYTKTDATRFPFPFYFDHSAEFTIGTSNTFTGASGWSRYVISAYPAAKQNQIIGKRVGRGSWKQSYAYALKAGVRVGPGQPFLNSSGEHAILAFSYGFSTHKIIGGQWANGGKGVRNRYLGFKFFIDGKAHYGWARLNVAMPKAGGTVTGYAYETIANKPLIAGKTKGKDVVSVQAATLAHLARGAATAKDWRLTNSIAATH